MIMAIPLISEKRKFWSVLTFVIILNAGFLYGVAGKLFFEIADLRATVRDTQAEIVKLDKERGRFAAVEKALAKESDILERIERMTVDLSSPLPFIELLERLAKEKGVAMKFVALEVDSSESTKVQKFRLIAEGPYANVFQYFQVIELVPYQISLSGTQIEFIEGEGMIPGVRPSGSQSKQKYTTRLTLDMGVRVK